MPTTDFSQTRAAGIARAEIRTGPIDLDAVAKTIASDPTTYSPLRGPGSFEHGYSPPEPEQPTEADLRARLADALATEHEAHVAAGDAIAARERAERHLERCQCAMRTYAGLDAAIAAETVAQLTDSECARIETSPELSGRLAERDRARVALIAAERALETLTQEQATICEAAAEKRQRTESLIAGILSFRADEIAARHAELLLQAAQLAETLHSFNQSFVGRGARLSPEVRAILGANVSMLARRRDRLPWLDAADALRADPQADVCLHK